MNKVRGFKTLIAGGVFTLASVLAIAEDAPAYMCDFEKDGVLEGKFTLSTEVKHGGEKSLCVEKSYALFKGAVKVTPGAAYKLKVWIKCDGCEDMGIAIQAACSNWKGSWLKGLDPVMNFDGGASASLLVTGGTHDWKLFEATIPADQIQADGLLIYLRHDAKPDEAKGKVYFDDLTLTKVAQ